MNADGLRLTLGRFGRRREQLLAAAAAGEPLDPAQAMVVLWGSKSRLTS